MAMFVAVSTLSPVNIQTCAVKRKGQNSLKEAKASTQEERLGVAWPCLNPSLTQLFDSVSDAFLQFVFHASHSLQLQVLLKHRRHSETQSPRLNRRRAHLVATQRKPKARGLYRRRRLLLDAFLPVEVGLLRLSVKFEPLNEL